MIVEKLHIRDRIESIATMNSERWEAFSSQHIADIGEVLEYLLEKIQELEEKFEDEQKV